MPIEAAHKHPRGYFQVRPSDVLGRSELLFLDVRYAGEDLNGDMGHIHGVAHLPLRELEKFNEAPEAPVVLVCANGRESVRAAEQLAKRGYAEVYHLVGGMLRWSAEDRPIARKPTWRAYAP